MSNLNNKVVTATKWSAIAEMTGKLISPISSIILARLLTPEAFGIVATLTMIIAFADIFTDAGFQRYIIQHKFIDEDDKYRNINVAFWSNLLLSLLLWGIIAIFCQPLSAIVGCPGLGIVLVVACASIPINAFSSIQMAVFKRSLDFKSLFYRRLVGILIPLFVTVPLAFWLRSYWALVIGNLTTSVANAIILSIRSPWHPTFYYNFRMLMSMTSFCSWSILDSILIWVTNYVDMLIISTTLTTYYLGIYKTSINTVGQFTALVTSAVLPIVLPTLSRLQDDYGAMRAMLLKMQKYMSILLLPLGFGIFMFSDFITDILLGDQWKEASPLIGTWGLMECIVIIFSRFCSCVYPAIGKPRISVVCQVLHVVVLVPAVLVSAHYGFYALFYTRALIRLQLVALNLYFVYNCIKLKTSDMITNVMPEFFACFVMSICAYLLLSINTNIIISFVWILLCGLLYFCILSFFPTEKEIIRANSQKFLHKFCKL